MSTNTVVRRGAAGLLAVVATVASTWGYHDDGDAGRQLDVTVVAAASPDEPSASDDALEVRSLGGRSVTVQSSSTATSDCDGCTSTASAVTVTYVSGARTTRADNVAAAWSTCVGCASRTASVQVVVLRRPTDLHATNRALALNASCDGCTTTSVAYQLVVLAPGGRSLDRRALADLAAWAEQVAVEANGAPAQRSLRAAPSSPDRHLADLEDQVSAALGPVTTVRADVDTSAPG